MNTADDTNATASTPICPLSCEERDSIRKQKIKEQLQPVYELIEEYEKQYPLMLKRKPEWGKDDLTEEEYAELCAYVTEGDDLLRATLAIYHEKSVPGAGYVDPALYEVDADCEAWKAEQEAEAIRAEENRHFANSDAKLFYQMHKKELFGYHTLRSTTHFQDEPWHAELAICSDFAAQFLYTVTSNGYLRVEERATGKFDEIDLAALNEAPDGSMPTGMTISITWDWEVP
jgi:hypothetical protein